MRRHYIFSRGARTAMLTLLAAATAAAAQLELPRGQVIPRVVCEHDARQSYALYLPSSYTPDRRWPVLFAFDPMARGEVPVRLFAGGAEAYGYVVIGSNNSRNGPVRVELEAMQAVYTDARKRFSFDASRVYTAGFSGGARVASRMGLRLAGVRGVVVVGGGFPLDAKPSRETRFALFGVAGLADFNYGEVKRLTADFESLGLASHFEVFDAGHSWPPAEVCTTAIEWFELQRLRDARGEKNPARAQQIYEGRLRQAEREATEGRLARAFERYEQILREFAGIVDAAEARERIESMKKSKELAAARKEARKREEKRERLDAREQENLAPVLAYLYSSAGLGPGGTTAESLDSTPLSFGPPAAASNGSAADQDAMAFEKLVAALGLPALQRTLEKKKGTDEALIAERQLQRVFVSTLEAARIFESRRKERQSLMALQVAAQAAPENGFVHFSLARVLARTGQRKRALDALENAAAKGFARAELAEEDEAFQSLRGEARFQAALEKMRALIQK